ncbi:MAG: hypothetical protein ACT4PL_07945 [Phycisphaerales bacterium]
MHSRQGRASSEPAWPSTPPTPRTVKNSSGITTQSRNQTFSRNTLGRVVGSTTSLTSDTNEPAPPKSR